MAMMASLLARSRAESEASSAVIWSVLVATALCWLRLTTMKVTAMKVTTESRIRVMTRTMPDAGLRDHETTGLRDQGTTGLRDHGTTGLRDHGTLCRRWTCSTLCSFG